MRASLRLCKLVEVSKAGFAASSPRPKTRQRELAQNLTLREITTSPTAMGIEVTSWLLSGVCRKFRATSRRIPTEVP
jgi:hypothetical protein